ncbi:MAG TPA: DUF1573 domain-containing protein [Bacteroidota bacterium]
MRQALVVVFMLLLLSARGAAQAKITVAEGTSFNLGQIYRGDTVEHPLTIVNSGRDTLVISRVDVSCGCTGSMLSNDHIGPGDKGTLQITFNSRNFRGPVHKSLTVNSNAADHPQLLIQFEGTVVEEVTITPEYLWFQDAQVGERSTKSVSIKNEGNVPVELTGFATDLAGLNTVLPGAPIKPGQKIDLPVEFTPAKATPVVADRITIHTSHPRQKDIVIPVYGNIKPVKGK